MCDLDLVSLGKNGNVRMILSGENQTFFITFINIGAQPIHALRYPRAHAPMPLSQDPPIMVAHPCFQIKSNINTVPKEVKMGKLPLCKFTMETEQGYPSLRQLKCLEVHYQDPLLESKMAANKPQHYTVGQETTG